MRRIGSVASVLAVVMLMGVSRSAEPPTTTPDETEAVRAACLDYVEGWFDSSVERVRRGVHPDLVKRLPVENGLHEMTREQLIESTTKKKNRKPEIVVDVYDVFKDIALAKVTSAFVDYVQLAKIDGQWRVVNVLWQQL